MRGRLGFRQMARLIGEVMDHHQSAPVRSLDEVLRAHAWAAARSPASNRPRVPVITTIIATIIVLGVLIFVHELGHFLVAKKSKVGVLTFSLGFGPKLFGKKVGETQYQVSLIPLGGYVKMVGEEPGEKIPPELLAKILFEPAGGQTPGHRLRRALLQLSFRHRRLRGHLHGGHADLASGGGGSEAGLSGLSGGPAERRPHPGGQRRSVKRWEDLAQVIHDSDGRPLSLKVERGQRKFPGFGHAPSLHPEEHLWR